MNSDSEYNPRVHVYDSLQKLGEAASIVIAGTLQCAVAVRGQASLALCGGHSPVLAYRLLASQPRYANLPWGRIQVFWSDERCVPPEHTESNYLLAKNALLDPAGVPEANIHRIRGEEDPEAAAQAYEREIRQVLGGELPQFDIVVLGMGADGHTASLFPGSEAVREHERLVVATPKEKGLRRVSFSLPLLNAARNVVVIVSGKEKSMALARALEGQDLQVPASLVRPQGYLYWLTDQAAASNLG